MPSTIRNAGRTTGLCGRCGNKNSKSFRPWMNWRGIEKRKVAKVTMQLQLTNLQVVDMEIIHYEWFDSLISVYRRFLQQAFGYSLELPVLGRRLQRFQESNRNMVHWRYAWIRRYRHERSNFV
eukprot:Gregarina_sp_Pseudo_9__5246@NODE_593_length_2536_cov_137_581498_g559_i0_p4_GENE_NODE_593_length_2536_cov_137_581498_g559_i0NODE_593_length_2536_cov_137_581498_g559_i0_p4_ORF_typecomplete_len123_score3_80IRS/PF02174_17/6_1e03IRS/PF02174_17/0_22_NODE_593_length_2536_cov_137_581498_g559_i010351403